MAEVKAKTAHRAKGEKVKQLGKRCPGCGEAMVATKVMGTSLPKGQYEKGSQLKVQMYRGMFWICEKCGHREPVHEG
jgi:ssDNA-binding Zn-finger/Zn-ribbon topoisomerase 1